MTKPSSSSDLLARMFGHFAENEVQIEGWLFTCVVYIEIFIHWGEQIKYSKSIINKINNKIQNIQARNQPLLSYLSLNFIFSYSILQVFISSAVQFVFKTGYLKEFKSSLLNKTPSPWISLILLVVLDNDRVPFCSRSQWLSFVQSKSWSTHQVRSFLSSCRIIMYIRRYSGIFLPAL